MATVEQAPVSVAAKKTDENFIHYLGIALIIICLLLLFCWMGKRNVKNYDRNNRYASSDSDMFGWGSNYEREPDKNRSHKAPQNDAMKNTAVSTVSSKWACTSSTGQQRSGFEVSPLDETDPNSGAMLSLAGTVNTPPPPSVPLSDGLITPGLPSTNPASCGSVTTSILSLTDDQIDGGLSYYGNDRSYVTV